MPYRPPPFLIGILLSQAYRPKSLRSSRELITGCKSVVLTWTASGFQWHLPYSLHPLSGQRGLYSDFEHGSAIADGQYVTQVDNLSSNQLAGVIAIHSDFASEFRLWMTFTNARSKTKYLITLRCSCRYITKVMCMWNDELSEAKSEWIAITFANWSDDRLSTCVT